MDNMEIPGARESEKREKEGEREGGEREGERRGASLKCVGFKERSSLSLQVGAGASFPSAV